MSKCWRGVFLEESDTIALMSRYSFPNPSIETSESLLPFP